MAEKGRVSIIGAGPGDPGLITLRGVQCIREADVIVYDHLVEPGDPPPCESEGPPGLRRQTGRQAHHSPGGDQRLLVAEAGKGGDRREAQGGRSLHLRPGGRGGGGPQRGGHPLRGRPRDQLRNRRARLCRDPAYPPEPHGLGGLRHGPRGPDQGEEQPRLADARRDAGRSSS